MMTNEEVDDMEKALRGAQEMVEEAGRIICSVQGETASRTWHKITQLANDIGGVLRETWRLRPEE